MFQGSFALMDEPSLGPTQPTQLPLFGSLFDSKSEGKKSDNGHESAKKRPQPRQLVLPKVPKGHDPDASTGLEHLSTKG